MPKNDYIKEIQIACGIPPEDVSKSHFGHLRTVDRDLNVKIQAIRTPGPPPDVFVGLVCDSRDGSARANVQQVVARLGSRGAALGMLDMPQPIHGRSGRVITTEGRSPAEVAALSRTFVAELTYVLENIDEDPV